MGGDAGSRPGPGERVELLERLGAVGLATALMAAGYYLWVLGGYLDAAFMVLQWAMTLAGAALLAKSLASDHLAAIAALRGRAGLALGAAILSASIALMAAYGWSQPGYSLMESFGLALSALLMLNGAAGRPLLEDEGVAAAAGHVGFSAATLAFALLSWSAGLPRFAAAFAALSALGILGIPLRLDRRAPWALPAALIASVAAFSMALSYTIPQVATDELAITAYAAREVLRLTNPYLPGATSGALDAYGLSAYYWTPLATGGHVTWLSYPALSFLWLVPAAALGIQARAVLVAATLALLAAIYIRHRGYGRLSLLPLLIALVDANVIYYPVGSVPDVLWALPLGISLALLGRRPRASAALYGTSLAAKQIPAAILPYLLYSVYRERGARGALEYAGIAAAAFAAPNAPFIAADPRAWLSAVLAPLRGDLVGIGQGPGMLSFLGYYALPRSYFAAMEALAAVALLVFYAAEYPRYRLSFVAFPILIFFFNYRFLFNYALYWPILALMVLPDAVGVGGAAGGEGRRRRIGAIALAALVAVPLASAPAFHSLAPAAPFSISGMGEYGDPLGLPGYVTSMEVNVTGSPPPGLQFRIFPSGTMTSVNGLLWGTVNMTRGDGWTAYEIEPLAPEYALPQGTPFLLEAHYGDARAFARSGGALPQEPEQPIANPMFLETSPGAPPSRGSQGDRVVDRPEGLHQARMPPLHDVHHLGRQDPPLGVQDVADPHGPRRAPPHHDVGDDEEVGQHGERRPDRHHVGPPPGDLPARLPPLDRELRYPPDPRDPGYELRVEREPVRPDERHHGAGDPPLYDLEPGLVVPDPGPQQQARRSVVRGGEGRPRGPVGPGDPPGHRHGRPAGRHVVYHAPHDPRVEVRVRVHQHHDVAPRQGDRVPQGAALPQAGRQEGAGEPLPGERPHLLGGAPGGGIADEYELELAPGGGGLHARPQRAGPPRYPGLVRANRDDEGGHHGIRAPGRANLRCYRGARMARARGLSGPGSAPTRTEASHCSSGLRARERTRKAAAKAAASARTLRGRGMDPEASCASATAAPTDAEKASFLGCSDIEWPARRRTKP
jgi:uncharacterized membrane protein